MTSCRFGVFSFSHSCDSELVPVDSGTKRSKLELASCDCTLQSLFRMLPPDL